MNSMSAEWRSISAIATLYYENLARNCNIVGRTWEQAVFLCLFFIPFAQRHCSGEKIAVETLICSGLLLFLSFFVLDRVFG